MYTIILANSVYHCHGMVQDGTERWTEPTLEAAIKSMKEFAWAANGMKIKKKDMEFFRDEPVSVVVMKRVKMEV